MGARREDSYEGWDCDESEGQVSNGRGGHDTKRLNVEHGIGGKGARSGWVGGVGLGYFCSYPPLQPT